ETLVALDKLQTIGLLDGAATGDLRAAYIGFRLLENRLQLHADGHTHVVPADPEQRAHLAICAGHGSWEAYGDWLAAHRRNVAAHFAATFDTLLGSRNVAAGAGARAPTQPTVQAPDQSLRQPARQSSGSSAGQSPSTSHGPAKDVGPAANDALTIPWRDSFAPYLQRCSGRAVPDPERIGAQLTAICVNAPDPQRAINQLDRFLRQTPDARRLLTLLARNPDAITLIVAPMLASTFIATLLEQTPAVADVVIDQRRMQAARGQAPTQLPQPDITLPSARAAVFAPTEVEPQLEALRAWTNEQAYLVALNVFTAAQSAEWGMATYSALAQTTIAIGAELARAMTGIEHEPLSIAAYGRLGGRALVPGSDLDLVFFAADAPDTALANRFAARLRSALGARMRGGRVYEIDTRLRPWGSSGPPVVPMIAFERHQFEGARTWEHLALFPARFVCGSAAEQARFCATQVRAMTRPRDRAQLQRDGALMLHRLRTNRTMDVGADSLQIKERRGGLLETEYLVAYLALEAGAPRDPEQHSGLVEVARGLEAQQSDLTGLGDALACWQRWYFLIRLIAGEGATISALLNAGSPATADLSAENLSAQFQRHAARVAQIIDARLLTPTLKAEIDELDLSDFASREAPVVWTEG
ncbi:MAG: hypothetical protein AAGF32_01250, partial [Pseudomonadota bacterium]